MEQFKDISISFAIRVLIIAVLIFSTLLALIYLRKQVEEITRFAFSSKLTTLSSTAGAFVDINEHNQIIEKRVFKGIRNFDENSRFVLSDKGTIHRLHEDGSVSIQAEFSHITDQTHFVSYAFINEGIIGITDSSEVQLWSKEGKLQAHKKFRLSDNPIVSVSPKSNLIALGPDKNSNLIVLNIDLEIEFSVPIFNRIPLDLVFDEDDNILILGKSQHIYTLDLDKYTITETIPIKDNNDASIYSLSFTNNGKLFALSDRLVVLNEDGKVDSDFFTHPYFFDHYSETYLNYVLPMREIRALQQLTYFYSFILNDDFTISYVLDASEDEDFTHIGYIDNELSLEDFYASRIVLQSNQVYISDIKPWGQWGLVKIAFAPIYNNQGKGEAIMGADQNVSSIAQVSREALVILVLSGFVFILIAASLSWLLSSIISSPLISIKNDALMIAAGFYEKKIQIPSLKDLRPFAEKLILLSDNVRKEFQEGPKTIQEFYNERFKKNYEFFVKQKNRPSITDVYTSILRLGKEEYIGYFSDGKGYYFWIVNPTMNKNELLQIQNAIHQQISLLCSNNYDTSKIVYIVFNCCKNNILGVFRITSNPNTLAFIRHPYVSIKIDDLNISSSSSYTNEVHTYNHIVIGADDLDLEIHPFTK